MVTRDLIFSNQHIVNASPGDLDARVVQALNLMRGRKIRTAPRTAGQMQFPHSTEAMAPVGGVLRGLDSTVPVAAVQHLLTAPFRAYALQSRTSDEESLALVGGYELP